MTDQYIIQLGKDLAEFKGITLDQSLSEMGLQLLDDGSISAIYNTIDQAKKYGIIIK